MKQPTETARVFSNSNEYLMKNNLTLTVGLGARSYPIIIGTGLIQGHPLLSELVQQRQVAVVTNQTVAPLYLKKFETALTQAREVFSISIPDGERYKNSDCLNEILTQLLSKKFDRKCLIIALGGGVVGDIAGFAASIYQRGVDFIQVPTTLLAQVDSSVGGKTAINHPLGKNMIGSFYQPKLVLSDVETLHTLDDREYSCGLAEMIKHGAISDYNYLNNIYNNIKFLFSKDDLAKRNQILSELIFRSCEIKADVVSRDERENGLRAHLNFGHTFAHAIEVGLGFGTWLHGEAVGAGMVLASDLSNQLGLLDTDSCILLKEIIASAKLPTVGPDWSFEEYVQFMQGDKKSENGELRFILLKKLGSACIQKVPDTYLQETIKNNHKNITAVKQ